jgi:protein-tyrosine phosphatase
MTTNAYDQIADFLFLGNRHALTSANDFSLIVNCSREKDVAFPPNHTNCIRLSVEDSSDESTKLLSLILETKVLEKIHDNIIQKRPVLVHCSAGMQRSCATVACYLMKYHTMDPSKAVEYIRSKRPIAFFWTVNFAKTIDGFYAYNNGVKHIK